MKKTAVGILVTLFVVTSAGFVWAQDAGCDPDDEFCEEPPCYRDPDNPDCNEDCNCDSPDYPECDPLCNPGDICDPNCGNPCWDEFEYDICSDDPPPCEPEGDLPFEFIDNLDGNDNGQIYAVGNGSSQGCGTLTVEETGYYRIYDTELSESCDDQIDETGYLTVANSCNPEGWAVERNAGRRFLVFDSDNTPDCTEDSECEDGYVCREGNSHGRCCVPETPVFMGTFLLVAGEDNRICINHWCPEWAEEMAAGHDFGFVVGDCSGPNSIHFRIGATAIACLDDDHLHACNWGCFDGDCPPDPCLEADCPAYCRDGECLDENPCDDLDCEHGCVNGYCLQGRYAYGPDLDSDGFTELADCDDTDFTVNPDRPERCGNGVDDNCDGHIDEMPCEDDGSSDAGADGGADSGADAGLDGGADAGDSNDGGSGSGGGGSGSGCDCSTTSAGGATGAALLLGLLLIVATRRRG